MATADISTLGYCQGLGGKHFCGRREAKVRKRKSTISYLMYMKKHKKHCLFSPCKQKVLSKGQWVNVSIHGLEFECNNVPLHTMRKNSEKR